MKTCTRFHLDDVEPGDRLHLKASEYIETHPHWDGPAEFDVTVNHTILEPRFGQRIVSVEKIGPEAADDFYLDDGWIVTLVDDKPACGCLTHNPRLAGRMMIVCPTCGNKRCPRATDCTRPCTGSNDPGQDLPQ